MADVYRPRVDPRVGVQIPNARPTISPLSVVGQALAETGDRVGRSIGRVQDQLEHDEHAWLSGTLAQARADWGVKLAERKASAEPGAPEFAPSLLKDYDEWSAKTTEQAKGRAQGELAARLKVIRADLAGDALAFETGARTEWAKSQITGALENGRTAVFSAPQHFESALGEQLGILEKTKLPAPVKAGLERQIRQGLTEAYVAAQVERDPGGMARKLGPGQTDAVVSQLSLEDRRRLYAKAESEVKQRASDARAEMSIKLQMEERAARIAEKNERKARAERELGLTVGLLAGQTTPAEIMQAGKLRQLGADQVRTLMSLSRQEGEGFDDWRIAADLRIRANSGEDVLRDALQARQAGAISSRTLSTITDEVQQQRQSGGAFAREDVKSARKQLEEILLDGQNMFTGIKAPTAEKVARADDMFRRRMMDDPTADPVKVRDQVLQTFKGGAMDETALPKSRFLVGTPRQPDIAASTARLQEALAAGRITQAEFLNEFEAIEEISKYAAAQPAKPAPAQPAAPAAGGSWFKGLLGQ
jgi:hypothetical protein